MATRLSKLRALLREHDLPALLVSAPAHRRYISGFTGSNGALLISQDVAILFTDGRYLIQAARESPDFAVREIVNPGRLLPTILAEAVAELGFDRLGFESSHISVAEYNQYQVELADIPLDFVPTEGLIETLRELKDAAELDSLRRAIAITDAAISAVIPELRPEMSELQAAWMLEVAMRERGAEALSFPIIVAAGPNSALPHARPSAELLGSGRPIVIDMGALLDGYHADLTRTICLGEPDTQFWNIYSIVLDAQRQTITALRPGLLCSDADAIARGVISAAGYGNHFGHGLGHGVGLNIHEGPSLRRAAPGREHDGPRLQANQITSVEPGIYLEGWGGVRIEDLVLLTTDGCEVLSQAAKLA